MLTAKGKRCLAFSVFVGVACMCGTPGRIVAACAILLNLLHRGQSRNKNNNIEEL